MLLGGNGPVSEEDCSCKIDERRRDEYKRQVASAEVMAYNAMYKVHAPVIKCGDNHIGDICDEKCIR